MDKTKTDRPLESLACVAPSAGGDGLRENLIVPAGRVESRNGAFVFNHESAELVLADFKRHGSSIPIDIGHESMRDRRAPAAGWIEELFHDPARGLIGLVKWNAATRAMLNADEFRYLSPVVMVRKSDSVVVGLESAGITNQPAIPNMGRIAASRGAGGSETETVEHAEHPAAMELVTKVRDALGMAGASLEEVLAAVLKIVSKTAGEGEADQATVTPEPNSQPGLKTQPNVDGDELLAQDPAVVVGQIAALLEVEMGSDLSAALLAILAKIKTMVSGEKAMSAQSSDRAALQANLVELQSQIAERDADDALRPFILSGHINPRDEVDVAFCRNLAKGDSGMFEHQMKIRKPYVTPGQTEAPDAPTHNRSAIIAHATREFNGDRSIQKMTSVKAYANLKLSEAAQGSLTDDEAKLIGA